MVYVRGDWNILKNKNPGLSQAFSSPGFVIPQSFRIFRYKVFRGPVIILP